MPVAYLAGEESALIAYLGGRPLKPAVVPPRPAERGLRRRPTLVQNPETLAHVALIARHGPEWFREVGTHAHPGSALVTVSGAVVAPGVREIACGAPLASVLGGALEPLRAVLVGGCHGVWIAGRGDRGAHELEHGGSLGAGVVVALGRSACPARELARTMAYLAGQSAGQCGPCFNGLPAIADLLAAMVAGRAPRDARRRLERWSGDPPRPRRMPPARRRRPAARERSARLRRRARRARARGAMPGLSAPPRSSFTRAPWSVAA